MSEINFKELKRSDGARIYDMMTKQLEAVEKMYPDNVVLFCALYGSQNYGLGTTESDVDSIAVLLPSKAELIRGYRVGAYDIVLGPGNENKVRIYDFRDYVDRLFRGELSFFEVMHTPYYVTNRPEWYEEYRATFDSELKLAFEEAAEERIIYALTGMTNTALNHIFDDDKDGFSMKRLYRAVVMNKIAYNFWDKADSFPEAYELKDVRGELLRLKNSDLPYDAASICYKSLKEQVDMRIAEVKSYYAHEEIKRMTATRRKQCLEAVDKRLEKWSLDILWGI